MDTPTTVRIAQATGVLLAAFNSGATYSISRMSVPALLKAPAPLMAQQWQAIFDIGKVIGPSVAIPASMSFAYLAYVVPSQRTNYAAAAILPLSIVPYTLVLMGTTNQELIKRADTASKLEPGETITEFDMPEGQTTPELIAKWRDLNYFRAGISLVGAVYGVWIIMP